tara:strand:- start:1290 stop:1487 length:198 start_codon:yes stop_codon:yes gene_type:complete
MDIFDEIKAVFKEEEDTLKDFLAKGHVEDYNHYRQVVGTLTGIEWSYSRLTEVVNKRMERDDDYD